MKFITTLCLTAAMVLLAGTAMGASTPRDVHPGLIQHDGQTVPLFVFPNIAITTTDNCLAFTAQTDDACANYALNTVTLHRAIKITNLAVTVGVSANAASTCDMFVEVDGAAVGTEMTAFSVVTIGTTTTQAQNLLVPAGAGFSINISDASGCYDTTAPTVTVTVEGFYVD
jgi:hypothetical protein